MTWNYVPIEIYQTGNKWPDTGTPADWIEKDLVGWCNGTWENAIVTRPLYKILWWKIKGWCRP
jgi:hypothetical protein